MIVPERSATPEERLDNARWILPSNDERLTLITCWPYDSNSHRLILVAAPLPRETILTPR
jgi:sortase A